MKPLRTSFSPPVPAAPFDDGIAFIDHVRDMLGPWFADILCRELGGTEVFLPSPEKLNEEHAVARAIGFRRALRLCQETVLGGGGFAVQIPLGTFGKVKSADRMMSELLARDDMSATTVARLTGVEVRTVYRARKRLRAAGKKVGRVPNANVPQFVNSKDLESIKAVEIVRQLLEEGHSPTILRDVINLPAEVIFLIRSELIREGKLEC